MCTLVKTGIIGTVVGMEFLDKTFEEWITHLKRIFNKTKSQKQQQIQGICGTCYCSTFLLFEETSRSPFQILRVNTRRNLNANINYSMLIFFFQTNHVSYLFKHCLGPSIKYAKFSEKLAFLTPWYTHVCVRIRGFEMLVFRKILRTYLMNDPFLVYSLNWNFCQNSSLYKSHYFI